MTSTIRANRLVLLAFLYLSLSLGGCFEDEEVVGDNTPTQADVGEPDSTICPPGQDCPCQFDSDCPSGLCLTLDDGSKQCARPCDDPCPTGWEQQQTEVDNPTFAGDTAEPDTLNSQPKLTVCFCAPAEVTVCFPSPEICDGEDNDCDGDTDEDLCDDGNPCTYNACDPEAASDLADGCTTTNLTTGCEDGNPCTIDDTCGGAECHTGPDKDCDDASACSADSCDEATGDCLHLPIEGPCDDASVCTQGDVCQGIVCMPGAATSCDDDNPCTDDGCDPSTGCAHVANAVPCDDGDPCTAGDQCAGGACDKGTPTDCDDGSPCTANVCEAALVTDLSNGCTATNLGGVCSDDNPCTLLDECANGFCVPGGKPDCDDQNSCTDDTCDLQSGKCVSIPRTPGEPCDDGNACTAGDACTEQGVCMAALKDCDDNENCTVDFCDKNTGICTHENNSGAACEDGNLCTLGDACADGQCLSGSKKLCDDSLICTSDSCDSKTGGCVFAPNTAPCTDGNPCTQKDQCAAGKCVGASPVVCDDGNVCTSESCNSGTGKCDSQNVADNVLCADADLCTEGDACKSGVCTSGPAKYCDDNNPCTDSGCDAKTANCTAINNALPCDDGNKCTKDDACGAGKCNSGKNACDCVTDGDCAVKEDGDLCNGTLYCDKGSNSCKVDSNTIVVCDASKNTTCTTFKCNSGTGGCEGVPQKDGTGCDADKSICSNADQCKTGVCEPGAALNCDDINPCTTDKCDPLDGCKHTNNTSPCFDGSLCSVGDTCKDGSCAGGAEKSCDDADPCTTDSCNQATGNCQFAAASGDVCDDGNVCTQGDVCIKGECVPQSSTKCDDDNDCTLDKCDPKTGKCGSTPAFDGLGCEDSKKCTAGDHCLAGVCKAGTVLNCWDGSPCTSDFCDAATGDCKHAPINDGKTCNDGDACTIFDICKGGQCLPKYNTPCDDFNFCTVDTCNKITGACEYKPIVGGTPCDDGNLCTADDSCQAGKCVPGKATVCNDGNYCTNDACNTKTGICGFVFNGKGCGDGNACTYNDHCNKGKCVGTVNKCNDGNVCTVDSCDVAKGCQHAKLGNVGCNDGNACTTGDTCASGKCKGVNKVCNDGNACTNDSCNIKVGCKYTANSLPCNDGNQCTINDHCSNKKCGGGGAKNCSDGNACTDDSCSVAAGCQHKNDNSNKCSDNQPCTIGDHCMDGKCAPTGPTICDDKNTCTEDSCDPATGCKFAILNQVACDDNSKCTMVDTCVLGVCSAGSLLNCDDNNPCTDDGCDPLLGCKHTPTTAPCDDADACTEQEACNNGVCTGGKLVPCEDNNICTDDACDKVAGCVYTEAKAISQAKMGVHSDVQVQTWADTKEVEGKPVPVDVKAAVPTYDAHPGWTANIPGAVWLWRDAQVADPTQPATVSFRRTFQIPPSATKVGGTLQVAGDDDYVCTLNGGTVAQHSGPGGASKVTAANLGGVVVVGNNELICTVTNKGVPGSNWQTNPAGLLFGIDLQFEIAKQTCDDGNACTSLDICEKGQCTGANGLNCNDGNSCTQDSCDAKGGCQHSAQSGTPCNDGNACSNDDKCAFGVCKAGALSQCDDGNLCTLDVCDALKGCLYNEKLPGKQYQQGLVSDTSTLSSSQLNTVGGKPTPVNLKPSVATYAGHPDWVKVPGAQWIWTDQYVAEPEQESEVYFVKKFTVPAKTEAHNGKIQVAADNTFECHLNDVLVGVTDKTTEAYHKLYDLPLGGALKVGENTLVCRVTNLGKPGLNKYTGPAGFLFKADLSWFDEGKSLMCDDGNACTTSDTCIKGACGAGPPAICNDANPCTIDSCTPQGVGCVNKPADFNPCNDGSVCTEGDYCKDGKCLGKIDLTCDDGNSCTADKCDSLKGCQGTPAADGVKCSDDDPCTSDSKCKSGVCTAGGLLSCDDNNVCTQDICFPGQGCKFAPKDGGACDDGDTCTVDDLCANALCLGKKGAACDDGNACTKDKCDAAQGCQHLPTTGELCEDGDTCTLKDLCQKGVCTAGTGKQCVDSQQCTVDTCEASTGKCIFQPLDDGECDDGNLCSLNDNCKGGKCQAGPPPPCGDGNPCTVDNCDPSTGKCQHDVMAAGSACDDGNKCTSASKCLGEDCVGVTKSCDDDKSCTLDSCDPATGQCGHQNLSDGAQCQNNKGLVGACKAGICVP